MCSRHRLYGHLMMAGKIMFGGSWVLVGDNSVRDGEKLLYSAPALFWCMLVVTQPHNQPGEEVGNHSTETTWV